MIIPYTDFPKILNCIQQHINIRKHDDSERFYVIKVFYPEMANLILNSNTSDNEFAIVTVTEQNYTKQNIIDMAKKIWACGLVPVEICKDHDALFFALPKQEIHNKHIEHLELLLAEFKIPRISDFYCNNI